VVTPECQRAERLELDPAGASLRELISLAHERGHERSCHDRTYPKNPPTMREEHRAWDHAKKILDSMGFTDWDEFDEAKETSLEAHRRRNTPEQ
jgi:hypothetical protein